MFAPLIPATGIIGFRLLEQTEASQRLVFEAQPEIAREIAYFEENIASATTAEALVSDRRLLQVALGAFGLDDDINKQAFLRKMLEEGTEDPGAFANLFVDPRYQNFVNAFGYGNSGGAQVAEPGFAASITDAYKERQFEIAVGEQDSTLRLALNFRREIETYATASDPDGTAWFSVLGDQAVRAVFEGAFGLGDSFAQLDIDRQQQEMREFNNRTFGSTSLEIFTDTEEVDRVISRFLARQAALDGPTPLTPGFSALTLFGINNGGLGSSSIQNILLSVES
ncbi:MAG: DUF1217 domain-containing protein [Pseudomonadota bacterium]